MVLKWPFHTFVTFELRQTILFCFIVGDLQTKTSKNELKLKYFAYSFFILHNTSKTNFTFNLIMSTQEILNNFYVSVKVYDLIIHISMTKLVLHTFAHLTGSSFRLKAKLLPIKNILGVKYN